MEQLNLPFWGGDASDLGHVHRLHPNTFTGFVDEVLNCAVALHITREEYNSMSKMDRARAKRVPYVVPCTFNGQKSARLVEQAKGIRLICIDIDDPKFALPYYTSPEVIAEQLLAFNFALHTTASSTPSAPRLRLFVEADGFSHASYKQAVDTVARLIGLSKVTRESYTVVQPMYLPTLFVGDTTHPLLWYSTDGRAFTLSDITSGPSQAAPTVDPATHGSYDTAASGDDLDYLRPVVESITLQDVAAALKHIDPDCAYNEWLEVAAALRHQFPGKDDAIRAYELFDQWSSTGSKYVGEDDTWAKWSSLRPNPRGRVPITIRSVMLRAAQGGWDSGPAKARCFKATQQWIQTYSGEDAGKLLTEGLGRVAATPMLSNSEEEALLNDIVTVARRLGLKVSVGNLRKDLRRLQSAAQGERRKKERTPDWAKGLCYVAAINKFVRPASGEHFSPEALDRMFSHKLLPSEEQVKEMPGNQSIGTIGKPVIQPQDYLLNVIKVPTAYDLTYDPANSNDVFVHKAGKVMLNTYKRNYPEPDPDKAQEAGELLLEHLTKLIAEPDYRAILLDYMAYIVQHPGSKIRWAVLLQGAEGCGKTFLAECMKEVLGGEHVRVVGAEALRGQWNDWAYGAQLVALEEVRVAGHNRYEVMNALKPLITNDVISINQRFRDSRNVDNVSNYILFTNHHDALALSTNDRRYFVLKSQVQTKTQVAAMGGKSYFDALHKMLSTNASGLRAFLEQHTISEDFPVNGPAPTTHYLKQVVEDSSSDMASTVHEAIEDSEHALVRQDIISSTTLLQLLIQDGVKVTAQHLASVLRDAGYRHATRLTLEDGVKHALWVHIDAAVDTADLKRITTMRMKEVELL